MAGEDGTASSNLRREEILAARVVDRFGLNPPVDLHRVAEACAEVESDAIPGRCDGLVIGLHASTSPPLILLKDSAPALRQRFTFAHELGHVLLPWHLGDYVCDTTRWFADAAHHLVAAETQANRFAAHLLVPPPWLLELIDDVGSDEPLQLMLTTADEAQVSPYVACIRLVMTLPKGHAFAIVGHDQGVALSGESPGSKITPPEVGEPLDRRRLDRTAMRVAEHTYGTKTVIWWSFLESDLADDDEESDDRSAAEILSLLLERHGGERSGTLQQRLGGIVGYANGVAKRQGITSAAQLYPWFRSRFATIRDIPEAVLEDPDFTRWLKKRAEDLGV